MKKTTADNLTKIVADLKKICKDLPMAFVGFDLNYRLHTMKWECILAGSKRGDKIIFKGIGDTVQEAYEYLLHSIEGTTRPPF